MLPYAADVDDKLVVMGVASRAPAERAKIETGDVVLAVGGVGVGGLSDLFRKIWAMGEAGVEVPITLQREERTFDVIVKSGDRNSFLKTPRLH